MSHRPCCTSLVSLLMPPEVSYACYHCKGYQAHHYYIYGALEKVNPEFLSPFLRDVDGFLPCVLGSVVLIGSILILT